jgi:hypothetical protein
VARLDPDPANPPRLVSEPVVVRRIVAATPEQLAAKQAENAAARRAILREGEVAE